MADEIDFGDLAPLSRDVKIGGQRYVVREASAGAAVAYRNATSRASRYEDGKFVGLDGLADAEPLLVGLCTYKVDDRGGASRAPVGIDAVLGWPERVQAGIYDLVRELSPGLVRNETVESIDKQLARLGRLRAELTEEQRRKAGGNPDPNVPAPATPGTSATAAS